ncbi:putative Prolamin-like domain, protein down-regulated in DIF1 11 [Arabidopsis thaliana]|uniref:Prolamin-like domain n=1 Tax=Arabidopsis thaliana x Arabidopsis arenosa TaxID=1240361 RepID=A0A8T2FR48_9BRAS|nr:Prolamin-like domain [Arabidopsis thaliana x Arabidopsis arenosa]
MENKTMFMIFYSIMVLVSFSHLTLAKERGNDKPLLISDNEFDAMMARSPASDDYNGNMLRKYSEKEKDYLKNCGKKMDMPYGPYQCADEVIAYIVQNKSVSRVCCRGIVKAGKECHKEWTELFFEMYQLKRFSSKKFSKTNEIWNMCSSDN